MKNTILSLFILAFIGCGFAPEPGMVPYGNLPMIDYAKQKTIEFFNVTPEYYEVLITDSLDRAMKACYGGVACNAFGHIIIHPDTDEYVCQQLLHEMGHSATYSLHQGWWKEFDPSYYSFISESCRSFGN